MTRAQDITRAFNGDWRGNQGFIPTPGHSAKDRGTTVRDTDDGDVVFNSFNGGDWRTLKDECRAKGLLPARERDSTPQWRVAGIYEFCGEDGTVLYRTKRMEHPRQPKRFEAERPNGRGGWTAKLGDVPRVLYRLPEIIAADSAVPVLLVEGERKADKLAGWGFVATAIAFGANGWRKAYAEPLAGRTVIILPDNDDVGRDFADKARKDIEQQGGAVHLIDLPGLPRKGDIMDWTGTPEQLRAMIDRAINPPVETFAIADLTAWSHVPPTPKAFVMPGFIPAQELTLMTGAGGANKSTFGQQLATCVAAGVPMLGVEVEPCKSLYITCEDDDDRLHWMQDHICRTLGVDMARIGRRLHLASLRGELGNELATFDHEGKLKPSRTFGKLRATIAATGAGLIVLDNVGHLFAGNENDRQQVTAFINLLYSLCRDLGTTVILIGHPNKAGDSYSGSTAWLNAVRSQIVLARPEGAIDPDERILSLGKANYARAGEEIRFRWHDFALVRDSDLPADMRAEIATTAIASGDNGVFLACLDARTKDGLIASPNISPNYAPSQFEAMPAAKGIGRDRLRRAMERLLALGEIEVFDHQNKDKGRTVKALRKASRTSPDGPPNHSRTVPAPYPEPAPHQPRTPPHIYYPPTGGYGAGLEAAAPSPETGQSAFVPDDPNAPDDDGNGNVVGWNQ